MKKLRVGYWAGKKLSKEHIENMRRARLGKHLGEEGCNWKGGKFLRDKGYVAVYAPNHPNAISNHVLEHRIVMEKILGRRLENNEIVHHINEIKNDNRPENLMLFSNDSEHKSYHKLLRAKS